MALGGGGQVLFNSDEKDTEQRHSASCSFPGSTGCKTTTPSLASLLLPNSLPHLFFQCMHFSFNSYKNLKVHVIVAALDRNHDSDWAVSEDPDKECTLIMLPASGELSRWLSG